MGINNTFFTQNNQSASTHASLATRKSGASGKDFSAATSTGAFAFFDSFLQTATQALEAHKAKGNVDADLPATNVTADATLNALLDTLPVNEGVKDELAKLDNPSIADILALGLSEDDLASALAALEPGAITEDILPAEEGAIEQDLLKNAFLLDDEKPASPTLNDLQRILKKIEKLMESEDAPAGLIAANLTPAQITDIKDRVEKLLAGIKEQAQGEENTQNNAENYAAFAPGLIRLLPPQQSKPDTLATAKAVILGEAGMDADAQKIGMKDLAATLNNLIVGEGSEGQTASGNNAQILAKNANTLNTVSTDTATPWTEESTADFESFLEQFKSDKSGKGSELESLLKGKAANDSALAPAAGNNAKVQAGTGVLQGWPFGQSGTLFSTPDYAQDTLTQMGLGQTSTPISSLASMTSVLTQSHAATLPHPGTQMVAATMKKEASTGEAKNITLQLDPPELGRVEIKMSFGKDKAIKAILTAEKPETFMMLQRDAHILERALQDAGLDAGAGSLSFELAQDNQDFQQNGGHDGSRNAANSAGGDNDEEIIETTMNWQVDPATGHMRYNIMV